MDTPDIGASRAHGRGAGLFRVAAAFADLALVAMLGLIVAEVAVRSLLNRSLFVAEEFSAYLLLATSFIGFGVAMYDGAIFRLDMFIERLKGRVRTAFEIVFALLATALSATLTWWLYLYLASTWRRGLISDGQVPLPLWIPQLVLPLGALLLTIACVLHLIGLVRRNDPQ